MTELRKNNGLADLERLTPPPGRDGLGGPKGLRSALSPLAGQKRDVEQIRADAWHDFGALTVPVDDARLKEHEREVLRKAGERIYGARRSLCPTAAQLKAQKR